MSGVNVGLMQFNVDEGGTVSYAVANIATAREEIKAAVDALTPSTRTPLSETLYEATLYLRGAHVDYGNVGPVLSVPASRLGGQPNGTRYVSPMTAECQKNFVVLLTDGEPTNDNDAIAKILDLPDFPTLVGADCDGSGDGRCLDDVAEYLFKADLNPNLDGVQNAVTYTIGFAVDSPLLQATASRGGGRYFVADDTGSLATALSEVVAGIAERSGTFAAPAIPVNVFNRATAERDVYVSVFQPTDTTHWPGNLKKYRFTGNQVTGQDGQPAVDPFTGFFAADAISFWSSVPDGDRVAEGGAASRLPAADARNLYTDVAGRDLTASGNRVETGNAAITAAVLGVAAADRDRLIGWIRGNDVLDLDADGDIAEPRGQMGDPLHVKPVTLDYGTSANDPETTVFVTTNDGLLHSVDAVTGAEHWAYLPGRLLGRQNELMLDAPSPVHRYGLDGEIRLFIRNDDRQPGIASGEQAILIFGMGRGGNAVFALDVTQPQAPRLLWQIDSTTDSHTGRSPDPFASLGQTWAAPEVTRVNVGGAESLAVVLSGGYDDAQDNRGFRTDTVGNAIFIIALDSGELLWSAGARGRGHDLSLPVTDSLPAMENSIPAAPRVLDMTGDSLADRLYVGDTGGRLWRFDLLNGNDRGHFGEGGVLASLGAADLTDPAPADVRRFYASPDVVLLNCLRATFLAINIGSGYRGHPLDTDAADAFFSVRDSNVYLPVLSADYPAIPIRAIDLLDITGDPAAVVPRDAPGWRLQMTEEPGEKVLNAAITFDNTVFFTSFAPGGSVNVCVGGIGVNRAYAVDACSGRPVFNLDAGVETEPLGVDDRFTILGQAGIAAGPALLFSDSVQEFIGLEPVPVPGANPIHRTYWMQEPAR